MLVYIYLSYKVYRYKAKLAAKNIKKQGLVSALRDTTGLITNNVHHLQTLQNSSHKRTPIEIKIQKYNATKRLEIGDKPKSSASHGNKLLYVYDIHNFKPILFLGK